MVEMSDTKKIEVSVQIQETIEASEEIEKADQTETAEAHLQVAIHSEKEVLQDTAQNLIQDSEGDKGPKAVKVYKHKARLCQIGDTL